VRFGDQLLLLNHATEVVLQADVSRKETVVDESHSQKKQFDAFLVTTGKVLQPCPRNCFTAVRANRNDGFGDSLNVHFGQEIRILASSFIGDQILYLHLQDDLKSPGINKKLGVHAALLPRAGSRTLWRIVEAPPPEQRADGVYRALDPAPLPGQAVRVNDRMGIQNVETGRMLMSDLHLVNTGYGVECYTFAEVLGKGFEVRGAELGDALGTGVEGDGRLCAVWSFVNDTWVDQVDDARANHTGGHSWKDDQGDDFEQGARLALLQAEEDPIAFNPMEPNLAKDLQDRHKLLAADPRTNVCRRIFPALRSRGVHFIRKMRKMCEQSDVMNNGVVAAHTFEGILAARVIRLTPSEFADLSEVFQSDLASDHDDKVFIDYCKFFWFLEGFMPEQRLDSVRRAYRKLKTVANARFVTVKTLMEHWNPESSRDVQQGHMDYKEACQEFIAQWDADNADGHITPEEFLRYYRDVSLCYEDGEEFVQMVKIAWDL